MMGVQPRLNYQLSASDLFLSIKGIVAGKDEEGSLVLQKFFPAANPFFLNHARTGIALALRSFGLPPGSKIGVQVYNCHTVFNAIVNAGHQPVFIDVNSDFRISLADLRKKAKDLDALIVTHTFGLPAPVHEIKQLLKNKPVIEDCAHAFLSSCDGKLMGTFGDAAVFSFGKAKFPAVGSGGFVLINNKNYKEKFSLDYSQLPEPGFVSSVKSALYGFMMAFLHQPLVFRYITRSLKRRQKVSVRETYLVEGCNTHNLFFFQKKIRHAVEMKSVQQENARILLRALKDTGAKVPKMALEEWNGFMLPILMDNPEKLIAAVERKGFELGRHFGKSMEWAEAFGYKKGTCPNAEKLVRSVVTIPCHYNYPPRKIGQLVETLKNECTN